MKHFSLGWGFSVVFHIGLLGLAQHFWHSPPPPSAPLTIPLNLAMFQPPPASVAPPEAEPAPLPPVAVAAPPAPVAPPEPAPTPEPAPMPAIMPEPATPAPKITSTPKPKPKPKPTTRNTDVVGNTDVVNPDAQTAPPRQRSEPPVMQTDAPVAMPAQPAELPILPAAPAMPDDAAEKAYRNRLTQLIAEHKKYPMRARRMGLEGTVEVAFTLLADGTVVDARVVHGTGHEWLDDSALQTIQAISGALPFPPEWVKTQWEFSLEIHYHLE